MASVPRYTMSGKFAREASPRIFESIEREFERLSAYTVALGRIIDGLVAGGSGTPGPQGLRGLPGAEGPPIGFFDLCSDDGIEFGIPGADGRGTPGAAGAPGIAGAAGISVPGIDGEDGAEGFPGVPLAGPAGPTGAAGATGATGATGPAGASGVSGVSTPPGHPGDDYEDQILAVAESTFAMAAAAAASIVAVTGFQTGSGNPQGVLAAAIGTHYIDTVTGRAYRKLGGASTAYGWYYEPNLAGGIGHGLRPFHIVNPLDASAVNTGATTGAFLGGIVIGNLQTLGGAQQRTFAGGSVFGQQTTAASDGSNSYITTTSGQMNWWEYDFDVCFVIRTGANIGNLRYWFGLSTAAITDSNSIAAGAKSAAVITYRTPASDAGWIGFSANAVSAGSESTTASLASIAVDTTYKLRIRLVRAGTPTLYFSIDDGTEVTLTTNIPPTGVTSFLMWGVTSKTTAAKTHLWHSIGGWIGTP